MSTQPKPTSQRSYPLSPPPHSATNETFTANYQHPRTPPSPARATTQTTTSPSQMASTLSEPASSTLRSGTEADASTHMQDAMTSMGKSPVSVDEISNKRKRGAYDVGDREQKKLHVEDRKLGINDLHLDVGKKYLLCRTPHSKDQPDLSTDLFESFDLSAIAGKVARNLPNGDKNSIRKTYKGKIKELGVSGKFDVVVHEEEAPGGLLAMCREPEMEWTVQNRLGKEMERGLTSETRKVLGAATSMARGPLPKSYWDSAVLGDLEIIAPEKRTTPALVAAKSPNMQKTGAPGATTNPRSKSDALRPKRGVSKRTYEDASFEGYGEGFLDDDMVDAGYSTAEGEDRNAPQKRRKKTSNGSYSGPMRHNSYGPGMVGA